MIKPNLNYTNIFALILFSAIFFSSRLFYLYGDAINPDGINWHRRSEQFVVALKTLDFEKTYQHYHPGVTLMWIMGPFVEVLKQISPHDQFYNSSNFLIFDYVAKLSVIFAQFVLSVLILSIMSKISSKSFAYASMLLLSLEPFFLGNSRLLHMDVLFSLLLFLGLITVYHSFQKNSYVHLFLGVASLALAFLTKSIGIGAFVYVVLYLFLLVFLGDSPRKYVKATLVTCFAYVATTFVFFPALWVKPVYYIERIFSEGRRIGISTGHDQIFFGDLTSDPGMLFYPVVIALKTSPVLLIGIILALIFLFRTDWQWVRKENMFSFQMFLGIFYLGYFVVMTLSTKKLDRYMLPVFPPLVLLAVYGYASLLKISYYSRYLLFVTVAFTLVPLSRVFPHLFTYTNPLFGSASSANNIIGQKPFGVGIIELRDFLLTKYGSKNLGFIDVKPIEAIYPNSKVFDIRVEGTKKYDLMVLAVNEKIPEKVMQSDVKFVKDSVLKINGLDYWTIYVKEK